MRKCFGSPRMKPTVRRCGSFASRWPNSHPGPAARRGPGRDLSPPRATSRARTRAARRALRSRRASRRISAPEHNDRRSNIHQCSTRHVPSRDQRRWSGHPRLGRADDRGRSPPPRAIRGATPRHRTARRRRSISARPRPLIPLTPHGVAPAAAGALCGRGIPNRSLLRERQLTVQGWTGIQPCSVSAPPKSPRALPPRP